MDDKLRQVMFCRVCGEPKMHTRLDGYRCHRPRHHDIERDIQARAIDIAVKSHRDLDEILDELWEQYHKERGG
jgi:hypothetical protein